LLSETLYASLSNAVATLGVQLGLRETIDEEVLALIFGRKKQQENREKYIRKNFVICTPPNFIPVCSILLRNINNIYMTISLIPAVATLCFFIF
jgi:hypothetical protein